MTEGLLAEPPLLLIPGLSGSCTALVNAARSMFADFRLIPFDHAVAGTRSTIDDVADAALAELPTTEPTYVCGESFGGTVALAIARRHPQRVCGLILLSTFAHHPRARSFSARDITRIWAASVARAPLLAHAERVAGLPAAFGRPVGRAAIWAYLHQPLMPAAEYHAKLSLIAEFDARSWLGEVTQPSLVIVGRRDLTVPPQAGRELARLLPHATLHELDCGHLAYLAMPDQVRDTVKGWRAGIEPRSPR